MMHRIRLAMKRGGFDKMRGEVEADETFIGGKARFIHAHKRAAKITGTGGKDKSAVMGLLERHGPDGLFRVRVKHVANTRRITLAPEVRAHVEPGAKSIPTHSGRMAACPTPTLTRSWTTPKPMCTGTSTPTGWKTSGLC